MKDDPAIRTCPGVANCEELRKLLRALPEAARDRACANAASALRLTLNERRLLEWLAAGRTNAQIARCINRSDKTVSNQLTRIYAKLGVVNRAEAVAAYLRAL